MRSINMEKQTIKNIANILGKFKDLKRRGWVLKNVSNPESDAEHSFSLAFLTLILAPKELNLLKCLKLALIHDLPEIYSSDFIPGEIAPEKKLLLEKQAINKISEELNNKEISELFAEFATQETPEARFVNALDKLDNVFTAQYYDNNKRSPQPLLHEFSQTAGNKISSMGEEATILSQILDILNTNQ